MRNLVPYVVGGIAAYLLGSVPFGLLVARARGVNIREAGSGNIGATNVFRCVGKPWGIVTFLCDFLKGYLPALLFPLAVECCPVYDAGSALAVLCGCMAVVGHNWPVYVGFKGGKGIATSAGALLGIAPAAMGTGLLAWVVVFLATRYVSLASILAALLLAVASWFLYRGDGLVIPVALSLLGVMAVLRHKANIGRLIKGTEHRFQFGRRKAD